MNRHDINRLLPIINILMVSLILLLGGAFNG